MRRSFLARILVVLAVVGLSVAAGAAAVPASASPYHRCQDGERIVHGGVNPLVVVGTHCTVASVNVGNRGAALWGDAHLTALDTTFHGRIALHDHAGLQMTRSTVYGSIASTDGTSQVTVLHSHIRGGGISGGGSAGGASSSTVRDTIVDSNLTWGSADANHLFVTHDQIGGDLWTMNTEATIQDTTVGHAVSSYEDRGLQICDVTVTGYVEVDHFAGPKPAYIGAFADPNTSCPQPVVSTGLYITDSNSQVYLGNVVVHGDLYCSGNSLKPIVSRQVIVTGRRHGQCR